MRHGPGSTGAPLQTGIRSSRRTVYEGRLTSARHERRLTHDNVVGVVSLIIWSVVLIVTVKFVGFVMRADGDGVITPAISLLSAVEGT